MPLSMKLAFDAATARHKDADGQLHIALSHISKATVNPYYGREIPGYEKLGLDPDKVYRMLRHPDELAKGAHTFARKQILGKHIIISANEPEKQHIVGAIGSNVSFNEPYLDADLCFWDAEAIEDIELNRVRELSCAYRYVPVMTPGIWQGLEYDGIMTEIVCNHLALVEAGRAGSDCIAADEDIFTLDGFNESDHPRATNGEFGAGGGKGESDLTSVTVASKRHPFVQSFLNQHQTIGAQKKHLETVPKEKLHTALKLIEKSGDIQAGSLHVKQLIEKELDSRADRGDSKGLGEDRSITAADEDITMKMTKLGKALFLTLGGMSPTLAADSALAGLVGKASKKNPVDATKIVAMDSALDPEKVKKTIAALVALDAEKEEKPEGAGDDDDDDIDGAEDEDEHPADCDCKDCKKTAKDKAAKDEEKKENDKAMDAKIANMRQGLRDADEAKRLVRPTVGDVVAQDSAEEIYVFALDQMKVPHVGVTGVAALRALYNVASTNRPAAPAVAMDHATAATMFPGVSRFSH
jgi:hypothetical protein